MEGGIREGNCGRMGGYQVIDDGASLLGAENWREREAGPHTTSPAGGIDADKREKTKECAPSTYLPVPRRTKVRNRPSQIRSAASKKQSGRWKRGVGDGNGETLGSPGSPAQRPWSKLGSSRRANPGTLAPLPPPAAWGGKVCPDADRTHGGSVQPRAGLSLHRGRPVQFAAADLARPQAHSPLFVSPCLFLPRGGGDGQC